MHRQKMREPKIADFARPAHDWPTAPVAGVPMKWQGKAASVLAAGRVSMKVRISPKASDGRSASGSWLSRAVQKDRPLTRLPKIKTVATPPIKT